MTEPRLGLALGCGSASGWAHIGVIPADLVLRLELRDFQLMDFHRAARAIESGHRHVVRNDARLEPILAQLHVPA